MNPTLAKARQGMRDAVGVRDLLNLPETNNITSFNHCGECLREWKEGKADGLSPREYARLEIGWTLIGLQVWCIRHDRNVVHIDFEDAVHPSR